MLYLEKGKGSSTQAPPSEPRFYGDAGDPAEGEIDSILEILEKKGQTPAKLRNAKTRVKMMVFLSRRGFRQETIQKALRHFEETEG